MIQLTDGETRNGEGRWLPVFPEMLDYFNSIPEDCNYLFFREDKQSNFHPLGYWDEAKGRIKANIKTAWTAACRRAGISGYNYHKTRQQAAMQLLYDNFNTIEVKMIGGGVAKLRSIDTFRLMK